jgi:hypothetical protein
MIFNMSTSYMFTKKIFHYFEDYLMIQAYENISLVWGLG